MFMRVCLTQRPRHGKLGYSVNVSIARQSTLRSTKRLTQGMCISNMNTLSSMNQTLSKVCDRQTDKATATWTASFGLGRKSYLNPATLVQASVLAFRRVQAKVKILGMYRMMFGF